MSIFRISLIVLFVLSMGCTTTSNQNVTDTTGANQIAATMVQQFFDIIPVNTMDEPTEVAMQLLTMVGREDIHAAVNIESETALNCANRNGLSRLSNSARAKIKHSAGATRVVIINEGHDQPLHREFIRLVANDIRSLGYTVYAAETFSSALHQLPTAPYAHINQGFYLNEPIFGALFRDLKRIGYRFEAYEHFSSFDKNNSQTRRERMITRDENQAENLAKLLAELGDEERILIHVGYSHAAEVPIASFGQTDVAWMATRLKQKTGIDPLTIDQTACQSSTDTVSLFETSVLSADNPFDFRVGHPALEFHRGRPRWRVSDETAVIDIPRTLLSESNRVIVEVRPQEEPPEAVPVDRIMLWPGEALPLLLRPGIYDFVSFAEGLGLHASVNGYVVD